MIAHEVKINLRRKFDLWTCRANANVKDICVVALGAMPSSLVELLASNSAHGRRHTAHSTEHTAQSTQHTHDHFFNRSFVVDSSICIRNSVSKKWHSRNHKHSSIFHALMKGRAYTHFVNLSTRYNTIVRRHYDVHAYRIIYSAFSTYLPINYMGLLTENMESQFIV